MDIRSPFEIKEIIEYVPNKVYEIVFLDDTKVKTICDDLDEFDPEYMLYLAYAKKIYSKALTFEGVLSKSYSLMYDKKFVKLVKNGMKVFKEMKKEKAKKEEQEEIKRRQHEKYVRKRKAAKERKRNDQINIIAEAIRLSKEGK